MSKLSMGGRFVKQEEFEAMEQQRLVALLEITAEHATKTAELEKQLQKASDRADKAAKEVREQESALKTLRALNPDRMKKQIKRLQEQNRALSTEVSGQKSKTKQVQDQLKKTQQELEAATQDPAEEVA